MDRCLQIAYLVARAGAWLGGAMITIAAIMVALDVLLRKLFVITLGGANELSGYALAIGSAWAFTFALLERAHIRINLLYHNLPVRFAAFLDILGLVTFTIFMTLLMRYGYGVFLQSYVADSHSMSPLATPLAIPQAMWVLGHALFVVVALLLLLRAVHAFVLGDFPAVVRLLGPRSTAEEIEYELGAAATGERQAGR